MQTALNKIEDFWSKATFETQKHKNTETLLVKMDDEVFELMQEH
jgi:hypothetical protein